MKLLGDMHSSNPPYCRQSTSALPQITIDRDESDDNGLPQSSNRSRGSSTSGSKNEVNWAERQFKIDFGDDDDNDIFGSIENFVEPKDLNVDEFEYDDTASTATSNTKFHDTASTVTSNTRLNDGTPRSMNFVKRPPSFKRNTDVLGLNVNATTPIPKKRQQLSKKSTIKLEIDEAWESQSARDHEAYMAKLQLEERRIALEREQGERKYKLEEERLELDRQRTQQQADQMNQILSLLITRIPVPKQD